MDPAWEIVRNYHLPPEKIQLVQDIYADVLTALRPFRGVFDVDLLAVQYAVTAVIQKRYHVGDLNSLVSVRVHAVHDALIADINGRELASAVGGVPRDRPASDLSVSCDLLNANLLRVEAAFTRHYPGLSAGVLMAGTNSELWVVADQGRGRSYLVVRTSGQKEQRLTSASIRIRCAAVDSMETLKRELQTQKDPQTVSDATDKVTAFLKSFS